MIKKNLISLSVAFAFLSISVTGLLLYFGKKMHFVETIHVVFGLVFIAFAAFHIINNWTSIAAYTRGSGGVRREFIIVFVLFFVFLIGSAFEVTPFAQLTEAGKNLLRGGEKRPRRPRPVEFEQIVTQSKNGAAAELIVQKKKDSSPSSIVIWIEDASGKFVENVFVPARTTIEEGDDAKEIPLTTALFSRWKTIANNAAPNYDGTSPRENFILNTGISAKGPFTISAEVVNGTSSEIYSAYVAEVKPGVFQLTPQKENNLLQRIILEIN